jgi:flagellar biosynthesis/type III secretory pathway protein FliH
LAELEVPIDNYCSSYEKMAKEIREGVDEGLNEGIKEGIKQGFVAESGNAELTGFDNIEVKCMEEILKTPSRLPQQKLHASGSGILSETNTGHDQPFL